VDVVVAIGPCELAIDDIATAGIVWVLEACPVGPDVWPMTMIAAVPAANPEREEELSHRSHLLPMAPPNATVHRDDDRAIRTEPDPHRHFPAGAPRPTRDVRCDEAVTDAARTVELRTDAAHDSRGEGL
jgi:hypothetical protein